MQLFQARPRAADSAKDWLAVGIGLLIFVLALAGLAGIDLLGWVVTTSVWTDATRALGTASKSYAGLGGLGALIATYVVFLAQRRATLPRRVRSYGTTP